MAMTEFKDFTYASIVKVTTSRRAATYIAADNLVDSARINANDTMREQHINASERNDPNGEWQAMFTASLRSLLCDERDKNVRGFFYRRGFYF